MRENLSKKILFLGYDKNETILIDELIRNGCKVDSTKNKDFEVSGHNLIIVFGYRYIIKKEILLNIDFPIINLHIGYLPWNKGAHPNFWSFFDCTPSGVTIHLIDEGIDTGPILYQKYVNFDINKMTFSQSYKVLIKEIEKLFISNIENIITGDYLQMPQRRKGSYHNTNQLPKNFRGWDSNIGEEIRFLDKIIQKEDF